MQSTTSAPAQGDVPLVLEMELEEDVPAELEHFLRLVMLGENDLAHEYFERVLRRHAHLFPVFAEYADFFLCTQDWGHLKNILLEVRTDSFSGPQRDLFALLVFLAQLNSPNLSPHSRTEAEHQISLTVRNCASLAAFAETGNTVTQTTSPTTIRLFQTLCNLRHHLGYAQQYLDNFYASLLKHGHLWEARKIFELHFRSDRQRYLAFKDAASNCQNRDIADLSFLAAANSHLATAQLYPMEKADDWRRTAVITLRFFLHEQWSTLKLIKRVVNNHIQGKRASEWVSNLLLAQRNIAKWQQDQNFGINHSGLFQKAAEITRLLDDHPVPGFNYRDEHYTILSDPAADMQSIEHARWLLDSANEKPENLSEQLLRCLQEIHDAWSSTSRQPQQSSIEFPDTDLEDPIAIKFPSSSRKGRQRDAIASSRSKESPALSFLRNFSPSGRDADKRAEAFRPAIDAEGQTIGERYLLGVMIGSGSFSVIREAFELDSQRKLAVKIVRRHVQGLSEDKDNTIAVSFEREVQVWRVLAHRHVLPVEAVYQLEEATFCFMPLIPGGNLFDLVHTNRGGVGANVATVYSHQIALALRYLHLEAHVVHGDIRLENCLVDQDSERPDGPGIIRLCDFDRAEWISKEDGKTLSPDWYLKNLEIISRPLQEHGGSGVAMAFGLARRGLEYSAPEVVRLAQSLQAAGMDLDTFDRAIVSKAIDIWAFGVCVYSLFVGSRPFQDTFEPRVVMAILAADWNVERLASKAGEEVIECVKGCFELDPGDRWDVSRVLESAWMKDVNRESDSNETW